MRNLGGAAILAGVLRADHLIEIAANGGTAGLLQAKFDLAIGFGLGGLILFFLVRAAVDVWRLRDVLTPRTFGRFPA